MTSEIPQTRDSCKKVIAQNNDDQTNMYTNTDWLVNKVEDN